MTGLVVERPGLLTTVQDGGRHGWQHLGVPVSGWMDDWSATLANRLAGNPPGHAVFEITLVGPTLRADGPVTIAVTGAIFDVAVGTRRLRSPFVASVTGGETIAFGMRRRGTRAYLACRGGVVAPAVLGSASTDIRAGLGGRRLRAGDTFAIGPASPLDRQPRELAPPDWLFEPSLRMLPGPDDEHWTATALEALVESPYTIAPASDRTGYRLEGPTLPAPSGVMVSAPVVTGTLQVPPSGQPILLMADCQTTGGYARLGVLAAADRALAAQLGPGDRCTFVRCSWAEAARAAAERGALMNAVVESAR
jgi:antagonist of KipI